MESTSKRSDLEDMVNLDKISKSLSHLKSTTDTLFFIKEMVSLSILLKSFDRNSDKSLPAIEENAQDPTYFIAAYFETKNVAEALWVYKIVRSLTRYILLSDRFYESGNERYALLAKRVRESVNELLQSEYDAQHLIYSIDYLLEQFSAFWKFEKIIKSRVLKNYTFSYTEIRHFNLAKSSDASLVYAKVLDAKLPSFNENVTLVLHHNQALLDIQDDLEDIVDDVQEDMPNIFVMAAVNNVPYNIIKKSKPNLIRKIVLSEKNSSGGLVSRLVNELQTSSNRIPIPENFAFLKFLSDRYADTIRRNISSLSNF